jgi:hypothetical protein
MTQINRVDQAILLLKDRLQKLADRKTGPASASKAKALSESQNRLAPIRQLASLGEISDEELRRAFVRTLLADSLGDELVGKLEFQAIADRVTQILEESDSGRHLLERALSELG